MTKLFYISPYSIDTEYQEKIDVLKQIFVENDIQLLKGSVQNGVFDLNDTLFLFNQADIFIADLSFERPSCYFEVGYAQALNKKIFLIAKSNTLIHQVIGKNDIQYFNNLQDYKTIITKIIKNI